MRPKFLFKLPPVNLLDAVLNGRRSKTSQQERDLREPSVDHGHAEHVRIAQELRLHGRPPGLFEGMCKQHFLSQGGEWPRTVPHPETDTVEVPATAMGLISLIASWDSLLTDEEYTAVRSVTEQLVPMGLINQNRLRQNQMEHFVEEHLHVHEGEEVHR